MTFTPASHSWRASESRRAPDYGHNEDQRGHVVSASRAPFHRRTLGPRDRAAGERSPCCPIAVARQSSVGVSVVAGSHQERAPGCSAGRDRFDDGAAAREPSRLAAEIRRERSERGHRSYRCSAGDAVESEGSGLSRCACSAIADQIAPASCNRCCATDAWRWTASVRRGRGEGKLYACGPYLLGADWEGLGLIGRDLAQPDA